MTDLDQALGVGSLERTSKLQKLWGRVINVLLYPNSSFSLEASRLF